MPTTSTCMIPEMWLDFAESSNSTATMAEACGSEDRVKGALEDFMKEHDPEASLE